MVTKSLPVDSHCRTETSVREGRSSDTFEAFLYKIFCNNDSSRPPSLRCSVPSGGRRAGNAISPLSPFSKLLEHYLPSFIQKPIPCPDGTSCVHIPPECKDKCAQGVAFALKDGKLHANVAVDSPPEDNEKDGRYVAIGFSHNEKMVMR